MLFKMMVFSYAELPAHMAENMLPPVPGAAEGIVSEPGRKRGAIGAVNAAERGTSSSICGTGGA